MTDVLYLDVEQIARVCHEANRAYSMATGDHSHPTWDMAPPWQKGSAIEGVRSMIADPDKDPEESHQEWMTLKEAQGWKHGPKKAPELLEHPCMLPYDELPEMQRVKDDLFQAVCRVLREHTFDVKGVPAKTASAESVQEKPEDSTLETGVLTEDGSVKKDVTIETKTTKRKKRKKRKPVNLDSGDEDPTLVPGGDGG